VALGSAANGRQAAGQAADHDHDHPLDPQTLKRGLLVLGLTTFAVTMSLNVFNSISPNFFRDELDMGGALNGYLIAIRELPGFLLIFVAALLLRFGLARATAASLVLMGVGFAAFASATSFRTVIIPTLVSSVGYHSWLQLQDALGLSLARRGEEGAVLGRFRGIGFAGTLVGLVGVLALLIGVEAATGDLRANQGPWLRGVWIAVGLAALVGAVAIARFPVSADARAEARAAPRITWRREYGLYYWLTFLDGSRQQIYFAFAPFVLVDTFGVNARTLLILLIVSALINWRSGPLVGKMVDRFGEKRMLTIGYALHLAVFLGFALSRNIWLLYLTYLGYNFLFLFSIGTTTYLRKICRREDLAPSLAMGVSLAHATAVVVPLVGALLWDRLGYQFPFLFGTAFIFVSLWLTQKIDIERQRVPGAEGPVPREAQETMAAVGAATEAGVKVEPAAGAGAAIRLAERRDD
jgi:predicted MFS family arabinose efflux permease